MELSFKNKQTHPASQVFGTNALKSILTPLFLSHFKSVMLLSSFFFLMIYGN